MNHICSFFLALLLTVNCLAQPTRMWGTYYGDTGDDSGFSTVTDASGNVYIAGHTTSTSSISTGGSHQAIFGGGTYDAFLAKFNSAGVRQWATYYGGTGDDEGVSVAVDANGNVFLCGITSSGNGISTGGSHQSINGGSNDAFLVKFNSSGVRQWATYYGGTGSDEGHGVAVDASGNVSITGETGSSTGISTGGSHQPVNGTNGDAFLVQFSNAGVRQWGTYYGGTGTDWGLCIAVDVSANIYIGGRTPSSSAISTGGSHQPTLGGGTDAFLVKFSSAGVRQWGTYYGGVNSEFGLGVATDLSGNVFLSGRSSSPTSISTGGSHQSAFGGGVDDAFLVMFNSSGVRQWGTYYGELGGEYGNAVITDASGNVYLAGLTTSTLSISTANSHQVNSAGSTDAFLVKFNSIGVRQWGTYFGGSNSDGGNSVALSGSGDIYMTGYVNSTTGISTLGCHQTTYGGGGDAFLIQFRSCSIPSQPTAISGSTSMCAGVGASNYSVTPVSGATSYTWSLPGGWTGSSFTNTISAMPGTSGIFTVTANNACGMSAQQTLSVTVVTSPTANAGSTQTITCSNPTVTLNGSGVTTYTWSGPGIVSGSNSSTPVVNASGTYSLVGSTSGCNSNTAMVVVSSNTVAPSVNANTSNSIICGPPFQGTATLTASGASTYTWNTSATTNTIAISPSVTTQYTVTGTNAASGCTNTAVFTQSVSTCTALSDLQTPNSEPSVYPNPNNGKFILEATYLGSVIDIYNTLGEKVYTVGVTEEKTEIDLGNFPNGIYLVRMGSVIKKVIKD